MNERDLPRGRPPARLIACLALAAGVLATGHVLAAEQSPTEAIRGTVTQVIEVLEDSSLQKPDNAEERRRRLAQIIDERFDYEQFAGRVLGRYWKLIGSEARAQFVEVFTGFLWRVYADRIDRAIDQYYTGNERVRYLGERVRDGYAEVRTLVVVPKLGRDLSVDYRLLRQSGRWQVYDVVVEGVSLVKNFRSQVSRLLRSISFAELLEKFARKEEQLRLPNEK